MFLGYTLKYLGESGDYKDCNLFRKDILKRILKHLTALYFLEHC